MKADFDARKIWLMKELWKLSEEAKANGETDDAVMLEVAGNIVENTFCVGEVDNRIMSAVTDVLNKE